jgi:DNA adenine methylase
VTVAHPILKWAGGKRQLLAVLKAVIPSDFDPLRNKYHEPFVGGGAFFFSLATEVLNRAKSDSLSRRCLFSISDSNEELINFYKVVRADPEKLIRATLRLADSRTESDFYRVRKSKPPSEVGRAARFLYLNRLCFNGLYRVNSRGEFNVPFGRYKNPVVVNEELIRACSRVLAKTEIRKAHFRNVLAKSHRGDLVYLDPPYVPLTKTASFSAYVKEDFDESDQYELADVIRKLTNKGVKVILSNSDTSLSRQIFGALTLFSVPASRSISASAESRKKVRELIGINYELPKTEATAPIRSHRIH